MLCNAIVKKNHKIGSFLAQVTYLFQVDLGLCLILSHLDDRGSIWNIAGCRSRCSIVFHIGKQLKYSSPILHMPHIIAQNQSHGQFYHISWRWIKLISTIAHFFDTKSLAHSLPHAQNASISSTREIIPKTRLSGWRLESLHVVHVWLLIVRFMRLQVIFILPPTTRTVSSAWTGIGWPQ